MNFQVPLFPLLWFAAIDIALANEYLVQWEHKMGAFTRPEEYGARAYALVHRDQPVAVAIDATLIRKHAGGELSSMTRENTIELARLCAARPHLCRVMLRLWREFVYPSLGYQYALSYQDADLHNGNTYRFDGWLRAAYARGGSVDRRTGRKGRNKWIWVWPSLPEAEEVAA